MEKLGLFACSGCEIGEALDLSAFEELADENGASTYEAHACLCSPEGVARLRETIDGGELDGLLIAACSQREKAREFRFDNTSVVVERASLREQVVWTHEHGDEDTQMLAEDVIRMGLARLAGHKPAERVEERVERAVLVVGGGLAGLQASLAAADLGHAVELVESKERLGGYVAEMAYRVPDRPPYDTLQTNDIGETISRVEEHSGINVRTGARIVATKGQPGQFQVQVEGPEGTQEFTVGAIVQATGARPYDAERLSGLGYADSPDVITTSELEHLLTDGGLRRPSDGEVPRRVLFVQCAGSRDESHLAYCSTECCAASLRQVATIHREHPEVECVVVYRDMRAPGQLEHFYEAVQTQPASLFTRGDVSAIRANGADCLKVDLQDRLLGEEVTLDADIVVLATGMVPNSADGEAIRTFNDAKQRAATSDSETQRESAQKVVEELAAHEGTEILNLDYRQGPDLPVTGYGFPDSHFICFPYETRRTGIYAAGALRAPMDTGQAVEDGWGAAMKAVQCIRAAERGEAVHPRAGDASIAKFELKRCTQCKRCTEECPFGTINEDDKGTPEYNSLRCRRCGICLGACPERIVSFPDYSVDLVASMIKSVEVPDEEDEKPRILAFVCENDALPALDEAARRRLEWNAWVRVIPVRCLGAINTVWIADSLSTGFDGVMLLGCKHGDDYQCHSIKGSELAQRRMTNVQETLGRLALEEERLQILEVARDEFARIPEIFDAFAETIEDIGPNPYKGF